MATRCKFVCTSVKVTLDWSIKDRKLYDFEFVAVTGNSEENKKFFAYTPSGSLKVQSVNDNLFELGKEYYLDIFQADAVA